MTQLDWKGLKTFATQGYRKEKEKEWTMLAILQNRPCLSSDLTIRHLEMKLKRYERRTQKPNAKQSDYVTRDRVALQLVEARTYLC